MLGGVMWSVFWWVAGISKICGFICTRVKRACEFQAAFNTSALENIALVFMQIDHSFKVAVFRRESEMLHE